eukprot:tig00000178_g12790.t1
MASFCSPVPLRAVAHASPACTARSVEVAPPPGCNRAVARRAFLGQRLRACNSVHFEIATLRSPRIVAESGKQDAVFRGKEVDPATVDTRPYGVNEGQAGWLEVEPGYAVWVERLDPEGKRMGGVRAPIIRPKRATAPRPTLVLDLDETMVHSFAEETRDGRSYDYSFHMRRQYSPGGGFEVYVKKRPYVDEFLREVSQMFELITFTASGTAYAEPVFDFLEEPFGGVGELFAHRLYNPATLYLRGSYVKDLCILGRDLSRTVIIDNSPPLPLLLRTLRSPPQWFGFQLDNGIPIRSYYGEEQDDSLLRLLPLLREIAAADDVRPIIRREFPLYKNPHAAKLRLGRREDNPLYRKDPPPPHGV